MMASKNNHQAFKASDELQRDYEELLLRMAFARIQEEKTAKLEDEIALQQDTPSAMDDELASMRPKVLRTISNAILQANVKTFATRTLPKAARLAAACLLIFFIGLTTAIATIPSVRVKVLELVYSMEKEYTQITLQEASEALFDVPAEWQGAYYPSQIPEIFLLENIDTGPGVFSAEYRDSTRTKVLVFSEQGEDSVARVDTVNADVEYTFIHGSLALVSQKSEKTTIVWQEFDQYFILTYPGEKSDAIEMAESVYRVK
ncbi:MAG: DUF4367 domain-containing protein [Clostridiales bacterium]|nr:DUF4367 domain-containing protein [Clostridiales bacterium]